MGRDPFYDLLRDDPEWSGVHRQHSRKGRLAHQSNVSKAKEKAMGDGWQHKDDYPEDPNDPQDWGAERREWEYQRHNIDRTTTLAQRKYRVHVQVVARGTHQVTFIINGTNTGGSFKVTNRGAHLTLARHDQLNSIKKLQGGQLPEAAPGQPYRTALGMVNNYLEWGHEPIEVYPAAPAAPATPAKQATAINWSKYDMNTKEAITLIQLSQGATVFSATYDNGGPTSHYHFKDAIGLGLVEGSKVVVQTKGGLAIVTVVDPDVLPTDVGCSLADLKHAVCLVDTTDIDAVLATERKAVHKLALSEVNDRLKTYRDQLGGRGFEEVSNLLVPLRGEVIYTESEDVAKAD